MSSAAASRELAAAEHCPSSPPPAFWGRGDEDAPRASLSLDDLSRINQARSRG